MENKMHLRRRQAKKAINAYVEERRNFGIETDYDYAPLVCYADSCTLSTLLLNRRFDRRYLNFLSSRVFPNLKRGGGDYSVCLDIGAYIGNHALFFAQYFDKLVVFEPHQTSYHLLRINTERYSNILTINRGCSNRFEVVKALGAPGSYAIGRSLTFKRQSEILEDSIHFEVQPLDAFELLESGGSIDFVKIDVEGHENEVIEGAETMLASHSPVIALEVLKSEVQDGVAKSIEHLRKLNYEFIYEIAIENYFEQLLRLFQEGNAGFTLVFEKQMKLRRIERLRKKNYAMVLCSRYSLEND